MGTNAEVELRIAANNTCIYTHIYAYASRATIATTLSVATMTIHRKWVHSSSGNSMLAMSRKTAISVLDFPQIGSAGCPVRIVTANNQPEQAWVCRRKATQPIQVQVSCSAHLVIGAHLCQCQLRNHTAASATTAGHAASENRRHRGIRHIVTEISEPESKLFRFFSEKC